jgi:hypothetical protein
MEHPILPKFRKNQLVSFAGSNNLKGIKKTFIHAISTEDKINYYYLIEHPDGKLLHEKTQHEFVGFDVTKLKFGLKYLVAREDELQEAEQPAVKVSEPAPSTQLEVDPNDVKTITMHSALFDAVCGATASQYMAFTQSRTIVQLQSGLSDEDFESIVANMRLALIKFKQEGIIDDLSPFNITE